MKSRMGVYVVFVAFALLLMADMVTPACAMTILSDQQIQNIHGSCWWDNRQCNSTHMCSGICKTAPNLDDATKVIGIPHGVCGASDSGYCFNTSWAVCGETYLYADPHCLGEGIATGRVSHEWGC